MPRRPGATMLALGLTTLLAAGTGLILVGVGLRAARRRRRPTTT